MGSADPFVLYVSKRFMDKASKTFGLGFLVESHWWKFLGKWAWRSRSLIGIKLKWLLTGSANPRA